MILLFLIILCLWCCAIIKFASNPRIYVHVCKSFATQPSLLFCYFHFFLYYCYWVFCFMFFIMVFFTFFLFVYLLLLLFLLLLHLRVSLSHQALPLSSHFTCRPHLFLPCQRKSSAQPLATIKAATITLFTCFHFLRAPLPRLPVPHSLCPCACVRVCVCVREE